MVYYINNQEWSIFMVFDIKSIYPPISARKFIKATKFAKQITDTFDEDISLIMAARKSKKNLTMQWRCTTGKKGKQWEFWCPSGLLQCGRGM